MDRETNPLVPYLIRHCLLGILAGWTTLAGLLATDVGGLRTLLLASDVGWMAGLLLMAGFAITFGSVAMGAAVMSLGKADPPRTQKRFRWVVAAAWLGHPAFNRWVPVPAGRPRGRAGFVRRGKA